MTCKRTNEKKRNVEIFSALSIRRAIWERNEEQKNERFQTHLPPGKTSFRFANRGHANVTTYL